MPPATFSISLISLSLMLANKCVRKTQSEFIYHWLLSRRAFWDWISDLCLICLVWSYIGSSWWRCLGRVGMVANIFYIWNWNTTTCHLSLYWINSTTIYHESIVNESSVYAGMFYSSNYQNKPMKWAISPASFPLATHQTKNVLQLSSRTSEKSLDVSVSITQYISGKSLVIPSIWKVDRISPIWK